jgi:16S rRNA processing protein RimM
VDTGAFVPVGRVARLHGLKGEIVVRPAGEVPFPFSEGMGVWFLPPPLDAARSGIVALVRETSAGHVIHVAGVDTADAARGLVGRTVSVRRADVPQDWEEAEPSVIGFEVFDERRGDLGVIEDVIVTGANDVWVVHGEHFGEILVPVIDEVLLDLDETRGTARVRLLPGLIEGE